MLNVICKGVKMTKYCANCGRELKDEAKYCPECGQEYIPRQKADGSSNDDFKGPFDDFSNKSSTNPFESSTKRTTDSSSNTPSGSPVSESLPCGKICIVLFIVLLLFSVIFYYADTGSNSNNYDTSVIEESSSNISNNDYLYDRSRNGGIENLDSNELYNISIDKNTYISGKGEAQLIDSNHSYDIESEGFNITEYETYFVDLGDNWYVLNIFKCEFENTSQNQVYSTDMDNGDPIIVYCGKGDYDGYGIIMPSSSNDSKFKTNDFLESIFHYKKQQ